MSVLSALASLLLTIPPQGSSALPELVPSQPVVADSALEADAAILAGELRCPVCQGNSIKDSPSEMAQEMRNLIRDQLRAGQSPDEVRAYFASKYGEWILLEPRAEGLNLVVYLVPFAVLAIGGAVIWRTVRKWTAAG